MATRQEIIQDAIKLNPKSMKDSLAINLDKEMNLQNALEIIWGNGYSDREEGGTDVCGLHAARVDRFVLWTDDQGSAWAVEYPSVERADEAINNQPQFVHRNKGDG